MKNHERDARASKGVKISLKDISVDATRLKITFQNESYDISNITVTYRESKLRSFLNIKVDKKIYLITGLKSIWEHLNISTYDVLEKREDNKVYNLYRYLVDVKKN